MRLSPRHSLDGGYKGLYRTYLYFTPTMNIVLFTLVAWFDSMIADVIQSLSVDRSTEAPSHELLGT
jgi:hypothetical protein